uniref:protein Niban 1-like n=2 Tax=Oncorhynchus TaxID=8016 RepID=UPI001EAF254C|nr:protein Niban 1-like [Oncorhynchus gorbuscha]XP_046178055.1 protein Niban 1-like [Oncorhynchus gorbuscha]
MGASSSSLLDETKSNYIRGCAESELKNFSPHYRQQYFVAFFSQLQEEVEQHKETHTQLLKQREPLRPEEVLYQDSVLHYDDTGKWKERFVVMRANHSLECHDNQESFSKGVPARQRLLPTGGVVLTSEDKYSALVDKAFPDPKCLKEETSPPMVVVPSGQFPVYLRLPYRRDVYFSFPQEDRRATFLSALTGCIRHQNHDSLRRSSCECQAFLKAIHFYRQEKGHYESWDMLVGCEEQVLANLVLEELQPSLQTELLARLKGKKAGRKRVWFTTLEAAYHLVQDQLREGLKGLKEECNETARSHEALLRSDMDQIASSRKFLQAKLQASVSDPAAKFCSENVSPYLASILEELMSPVTGGFQGVRLLLEGEMNTLCLGFPEGAGQEGLNQALGQMCQASLEECYQKVEVLTEQLQELRHRFKFSNSVRLIHCTQIDMQQLMENAVYTFKLLLQSSLKDNTSKLTSAMEKAKLRVLKQYDHDSSTVRKRIFQKALVDIALPAIRRNLAPAHKPDLQKLDQYIFADYTNFIKVENIYEDILLNILTIEVDKVVKEAASLRKNNLMVDSTDLQSISQSSLTDRRTPPLSAPASPAKMAVSGLSRQAEREPSPLVQNLSSSAGRLEVEGGPVAPDMAALTPPVIVITPQSEAPDPDPAPLSLPGPAHILTYTADVSVAEPDTPSPLPDTPSPLPDTPSPLPDTPSPLPDTPSPLPDTPSPLPDTPSPLPDTHSPLPDTPSPLPDTPSPLPDTPSPLPEMSSAESDYPAGAASTKPDASLVNHDAPLATITPYAPSPQPPIPVAEPAPQTPEVTDTAKVSQPPGTEDKPDTVKARNSPVSDSVSVCVEALSAVSMILPEATVLSTGQRQRQATDRAVYLKTPAGVKEGASVPLTVDEKEEEEEHLCKEAEAHHMGTAPSNMGTGPSNIGTAPSNIGTGPSNIGTAPSNIGTGPSNIGTGPSNIGTGPSNIGTGPSNIGTGPSNIGTGPSNIGTGPSNIGTAPSNIGTGPSNIGTGPSNIGTGPSNMGTGPSTEPASQTQNDLNPTGSEMQPGGSEDRAEVTSVTRVTVTESEGALLACNTLVTSRGGATTPLTGPGQGVVEAGVGGEALGGVVEAGDRGEALGGVVEAEDRGEALGGVVEAEDRGEALGGVVEAEDRGRLWGCSGGRGQRRGSGGCSGGRGQRRGSGGCSGGRGQKKGSGGCSGGSGATV